MRFPADTNLLTFVVFLTSIDLSLQLRFWQQEGNNNVRPAGQNQILQVGQQNHRPVAQDNPVRTQNQPPRHDPALAYNNLPSNSAPYAYRNRHNNVYNNQQYEQRHSSDFTPLRHEHNPLGFMAIQVSEIYTTPSTPPNTASSSSKTSR